MSLNKAKISLKDNKNKTLNKNLLHQNFKILSFKRHYCKKHYKKESYGERRIFAIVYLMRVSYPEYINIIYKPTRERVVRQPNAIKIGGKLGQAFQQRN